LRRGRWVVAWLACSLVTLGLFAKPKTTPIHPDEVYWIGSTYYHHLAFERRDWRHPDWMLQPARENPPVAKYVIGLGLALQGQHIVNRDMLGCFHLMFVAPGAWGEGEEYAKRVAVVGAMNPTTCRQVQGGPGVTKPRALPHLARYVMLLCAAVTSLLLFLFGASVATPPTGLIASQLLLLHPFMIHASNRTMSDPVALMFGTATAFATWKFLTPFVTADTTADTGADITARVVRAALLTGVLLALACGAKMNSLIVVFLFGGGVIAAAAIAWRNGDKKRASLALWAGALGLSVALALFVLINPAILFDLLGGLVALVREPQLNTAIQARVMFQLHLTGFGEKSAGMASIAGGVVPFLLAATLVLAAAWKWNRPGVWLIVAWWAISVACVTAWIPFDWSRYMLPILPPFALLVAHALVMATERMRAKATTHLDGLARDRGSDAV
jgi:hypothetical protein